MNVDILKEQVPEFAKDIKLNLAQVLTPSGAPDLNEKQICSIALSSAYALKNTSVISELEAQALVYLSTEEINACKAAATIMAMNNVYYRFTHLVSDPIFSQMPAKLRMNIMTNSGLEKITFELCSLAVSAINGCGMCMDAHVKQLTQIGCSSLAIQSCIRIASVINALVTALSIKPIH